MRTPEEAKKLTSTAQGERRRRAAEQAFTQADDLESKIDLAIEQTATSDAVSMEWTTVTLEVDGYSHDAARLVSIRYRNAGWKVEVQEREEWGGYRFVLTIPEAGP